MIISASRRTDIPAFYADWLIRRLTHGFCRVPNPRNPRQESRISLAAGDVTALVLWTRHPQALLPKLSVLDDLGMRYYFLYTVLAYPQVLEPHLPPLSIRIRTFESLASRIGPDRVIWRYDPIVLSMETDVAFHLKAFKTLSETLSGMTRRCVISFVDDYPAVRRRMAPLVEKGFSPRPLDPATLQSLLPPLVDMARKGGMEVTSCAEPVDLRPYGVSPGKCVDDRLIRELFGIPVYSRKDKGQRPLCRCVESRDIGVYGTCRFGCVYCYAAGPPVRENRSAYVHDPDSPCLVSHRFP